MSMICDRLVFLRIKLNGHREGHITFLDSDKDAIVVLINFSLKLLNRSYVRTNADWVNIFESILFPFKVGKRVDRRPSPIVNVDVDFWIFVHLRKRFLLDYILNFFSRNFLTKFQLISFYLKKYLFFNYQIHTVCF